MIPVAVCELVTHEGISAERTAARIADALNGLFDAQAANFGAGFRLISCQATPLGEFSTLIVVVAGPEWNQEQPAVLKMPRPPMPARTSPRIGLDGAESLSIRQAGVLMDEGRAVN